MSSLIVEICKIDKIIPIEKADKIEAVQVKGWNCIVGKGQYSVGQLCVFVPPDSVIPPDLIEKYNLEYLRSDGRVKTVKLRGFVSQGLILDVPPGNYNVGDDVSALLGIKKYEVPEPTYSKTGRVVSKKKLNPNFDRYTDIENVKHFPNIFCPGDMVVISEKIHGSSFRAGNLEISINPNQPFWYRAIKWVQKNIFKVTHEWVYGSHNVQKTVANKNKGYYGDDIWGKVAKKYDLKNKIEKDFIVYGEVYGKSVQDLEYGLNDIDLVVFDIKYKGEYVAWPVVDALCEKWSLRTVPILYAGHYREGLLKEYTDGKSILFPGQIREGCVIKSLHEENHPRLGRKILKSVSADYLTRKNGTEYK